MGRSTAVGGTFAPASPQQPVEPGQRVRTDGEIDLQNLSAEERDVVNADDFVVFGRCNIEQWNDPGPGEDHLYIEMDALEDKLDQLLAIDNISFGHQDVRVGEPLASYTLDDAATVHLDRDESLQFDAGDELRTQVIREGEPLPDGSGPADEDALWLAANIFGRDDPRGSRFSQQVRLGAYYGDLDGFSVTIDKLEMTPTEQGVRTHEVDFLAVTVGDDEMIKNPGSSFGVAEFQALLGIAPREAAAAEGASPGRSYRTTLMGSIMQSLLGSSKDALASEAIQQAYDDDSIALQDAVEQVAGDEADTVLEQAEAKVDDLSDGIESIASEAEDADADEVEDRAAELADALGMDKEFIMEMVAEARAMADEAEPDEPGDDDPEPDDPEQQQVIDENELVDRIMDELPEDANVAADDLMSALDGIEYEGATAVDAIADAVGQAVETPDTDQFVTEEQLDDRLDGLASSDEIEEQLADLGNSISDDIGSFVEEQMQTGQTPGPTGGGVNIEDFESQAEEWADEITPEGRS